MATGWRVDILVVLLYGGWAGRGGWKLDSLVTRPWGLTDAPLVGCTRPFEPLMLMYGAAMFATRRIQGLAKAIWNDFVACFCSYFYLFLILFYQIQLFLLFLFLISPRPPSHRHRHSPPTPPLGIRRKWLRLRRHQRRCTSDVIRRRLVL